MHVFCDFDGTISIKDTSDEIFKRFALPEWEIIEEEWKQGRIGSAECMQRQVALIRTSKQALDAALDAVQIDAGFSRFNDYCRENNIALTVISDGVDYFINRILERNDLNGLPVIANTLEIEGDNYSLTSVHANPECSFGYGVCKCQQIAKAHGLKFFVGDGRSDFCAVHKADIVFAKGTLATYCREQNIKYNDYNSFSEILEVMRASIPALIQPAVSDLTNYNIGEYNAEYA